MIDLDQVRAQILERADIVAFAERAGFRRRGHAWFCGFHQDRRHPSASLRKGRVHCFVCNRTWNAIDLAMEVSSMGYVDALRQLAAEHCIPWPGADLSPAERADFARRRRAAEAAALPFAQRASWWRWARRAELNAIKAAAVRGNTFDVDALSAASRELYRLESMAPASIIRAYLQFEAERPADCARLVSLGSAREDAGRAVVGDIIRFIEREQRKAAPHAA